MIVYTLNLIFTTLINYLSRLVKNKKISIFLIGLAVLFASLVAGLRYGVGTDYFAYVDWFNSSLYNSISFSNYQDFGFTILLKGLQLFTDNPQIFFFTSAFITYLLIMKFIKQNTELYDLGFFLFITLYLYYSSLNIVRQWISIAIFLYSLKYAYNRNFIKYLIINFLAASFHISSLLMLPFYFIFKFRANIRNLVILFFTATCIALFFEPIILRFANFVPFFNAERYTAYFDSIYSTSGGGGWAYTIILLGTFVLMLIYRNQYMSIIKNGRQHYILLIFATAFSFFAPSSMIFSRIQLFLMPIVLVCIPNLVKIQKPKDRIIFTFIIILLGIIYMYRSLNINGGEPLPYISIFGI